MRWRDWLPFGTVPELSPEEVARLVEAAPSLQIIDVRTALEFRNGHIAGAVHVPVHELEATLPALALDHHIPMVVVCKTAHRSIPAVRLLRETGLHARQLQGGMDRWRRLGFPVVTGGRSSDGDSS